MMFLLLATAHALSCGDRIQLAMPPAVRALVRDLVPSAGAAQLASLNARLQELMPADYAKRELLSEGAVSTPRGLTRRAWVAHRREAVAVLQEIVTLTTELHGADSTEAALAHLSLALADNSVEKLRLAADLLEAREHGLAPLARLRLARTLPAEEAAGELKRVKPSPALSDEQNDWILARARQAAGAS